MNHPLGMSLRSFRSGSRLRLLSTYVDHIMDIIYIMDYYLLKVDT